MAIKLYPTSKYQLKAVAEVLDTDILLGLEVLKTACASAGEKKLTTYFYAKDRGVTDEQLHGVIEKLSKAGYVKAETVASPKGDINYVLSLTGVGVKAFEDAKAESAAAFAEYQAKQG